ncbi:prephenate dehydrogenase/arogenate dehydrogenase family protein [Terasakiella pusilla]|uniref:prephenate dehydrogenase/arogenate dehydrogenase family protein n=1 Tax=Terasakiella pusilla TaxID=64973 RepID=UPI003AA9E120
MSIQKNIKTVGLLGFGAFGRLIATHIGPHVDLLIHDPHMVPPSVANDTPVRFRSLTEVAACDLVILAMPVSALEDALIRIRPHLQTDAIVLDVGSVKLKPVEQMSRLLPDSVHIIATHPLFGPQSGKDGIEGLKIVLCPVRGNALFPIAAFLKRALKLSVIISTADQHDRDVAVVQGLTHLIGQVLARMEPFPTTMTTPSFELLKQVVDMVRHDSVEVYRAIEQENPHAASVRQEFFGIAQNLLIELDSSCHMPEKYTELAS